MEVSIHAPTRGATMAAGYWPNPEHVSIHAPTRGATGGLAMRKVSRSFQSTRPRGARRTQVNSTASTIGVSIHAPTRGATVILAAKLDVLFVSIHAPTRGATTDVFDEIHVPGCFNPRAHAGRDGTIASSHNGAQRVSIHAPTRGATTSQMYLVSLRDIVSIHAPTRGATAQL